MNEEIKKGNQSNGFKDYLLIFTHAVIVLDICELPTKWSQTFWMKNCYTKDTLQQTILKKKKKKKKHGWTAFDIVGAGSSKFKVIQGRFYLLYPFRLNGESAREHQGALILGL